MLLLLKKLKEVSMSVIPITILVFLLHLTISPLTSMQLARFMIGALLITMGLTLFLSGVQKGIAPLGTLIGETILKSNKLSILLLSALLLGFFISIAEPGLIIFSQQIELVTNYEISSLLLLGVVSLGIGVLLALAFYRIVMNVSLKLILVVLYGIIFILAMFVEAPFIIIAFDASGATTGVLAVPFILALALGISHLKRDSHAGEQDSFGTIAIVSAGAIMAVLFLGFFSKGATYSADLLNPIEVENTLFAVYRRLFNPILKDVFQLVLPLYIIFIIFNKFWFKLKTKSFLRISRGFIYTFVGLLIFLLGVNAGFMDVGHIIGMTILEHGTLMYILGIAFIIGLLTILAEPAVHVLTHQIEDVTSGYVTKNAVMLALSLGVGMAVSFSALRIFIDALQIWHFLLPGYILAIILMFLTPKLFVGMAYDAGGVATGPMTVTFILAFMQGLALNSEGIDVILDGFGMIAMVAMVPIITIQLLGLIFKWKSKKEGIPDG